MDERHFTPEMKEQLAKLVDVIPFLHAGLRAVRNTDTVAITQSKEGAFDPFISIDGTIMVMWDVPEQKYRIDLIIPMPGTRDTPPEEDYTTLHTPKTPAEAAKLGILAWAGVMVDNGLQDAGEYLYFQEMEKINPQDIPR